MEAIGLNPIRLDAIGIDPIRLNAIRLGVPGASSGSVRPYIDPEVLASLVAVCICDGKSNNDPDRAVIKNFIDPANPFVISNAAYKLNSGFGKYEEDFTTLNNRTPAYIELNPSSILVQGKVNDLWLAYTTTSPFNLMKIRIKGLPIGGRFEYRYYNGVVFSTIVMEEDGEYKLPASQQHNNGIGFRINDRNLNWTGFIVEQIPSFQGALITDGVNDLITSTKSVQEMLGGSNEITVVSMIHQIEANVNNLTNTNNIRVGSSFIRNSVVNVGKTGIYGYTFKNTVSLINNILGDKNDYTAQGDLTGTSNKFSVEGMIEGSTISQTSQVAWYWTFIAKRALTTDQINQVIAYYNLDKYVKPDIYYDVKKQGLTNDTPDTDWYLKDFSGNGRDMQLYNFAKKLGSGVGKYAEDFKTWRPQAYVADFTHTSDKLHVTKINNSNAIIYTKSNVSAIRVKVTGVGQLPLRYKYILEGNLWRTVDLSKDGIYELPSSVSSTALYTGFVVESYVGDCDITIEQIPDYEGALVFDAVEDYGQFVGDLGLKDYTVAVDRAYPSFKVNAVPVISDTLSNSGTTPFLFEFQAGDKVVRPFSFGSTTILTTSLELNRKISYQSTYVYNNTVINKGKVNGISRGLTIGRFGANIQYANIALWSLLLFPYSLSEFLLERQLKRYKLGTLHPDMVEVRPIINSTGKYFRIEYRNGQGGLIQPGSYLPVSSILRISVVLNNNWDEVSSLKVDGVDIPKSSYSNNNFWIYDATVTKSPQKIDITIDEYIRYEDIVQPYPCILNIPKKEGNGYYTYGDKIPVGYKFIRSSVNQLLPELYQILRIYLNGEFCDIGSEVTVSKEMVFSCDTRYLKDNEPNCILSPQTLRIPNASYKILSYIPDLTGKGNHGKINNSAYAGMSGANGYKYDWSNWIKYADGKLSDNSFVMNTSATMATTKLFSPQSYAIGDKSYSFRFKISGLINNQRIEIDYPKDSDGNAITSDYLSNGEYYTKDYTTGEVQRLNFFLINANIGEPVNIKIEQIGEYEGSFCLDGVEDFITIPTLSHGAKQVLMKVNWNSINTIAYDHRNNIGSNDRFAIYLSDVNGAIAYNARNNGQTYIDGILNTNIIASQLKDITHNITITNSNVTNTNSISPRIGVSVFDNLFAQMALFSFMSFDDISSEDEIKELNDIVGIEGNTDDLFNETNI